MSRRPLASLVLALAAVTALAPARRAEAGPGVRFGLTDDPDTVFLGFFDEAWMGGGRSGRFVLEPGGDIGFHDDTDYWTLRGDLRGKYMVPMGRSAAIYPLVGLSIYYINVDCGAGRDCDHTDAGLDLGGGLAFGPINVELFLGIDDIPDATFQVGFSF
jgi:hypothetical protein